MFKEQDSKFFTFFEEGTANIVSAAELLLGLVQNIKEKDAKTAALEELEHKGDELTHNIIAELHKAFFTPIDREDIFTIAKELDTIVDLMETAAHRFIMFNIDTLHVPAQKMAELIFESSKQLDAVMKELRKPKSIAVNNRTIVEINRIENEGDKLYREVVQELYSGAYDTLTVVKWKEIYEHLENTLDALEDVANIIEGIAMKHS